MEIIADLHLHGRYSRGCSTNLDIASLEKGGKVKGLDLMGTGDFTHPLWLKELKENLKDDGYGVLKTKKGNSFILQTEISLIYSQDNKGRRVHNVVLAPDFDVVEQIIEVLGKRGRLDYDGRPIFNIPCPEFIDLMKGVSEDVEVIPAHIFTPWFSLFGSKSGFDSIKECFQERTKDIHALETGLSSDPAMDRKMSQLDNFKLVSFSDSHSFWPWRLGREATIFDLKELRYKSIINALRKGEGLKGTVEVDPGYGKYHLDGHRNCKVCLEPQESLRYKGICPKCGRSLTLGVLNRVEALADREIPKKEFFYTLIPLSEIIAKALGAGIATKKVWDVYNKLIEKFGNEFKILLDADKDSLKEVVGEYLTNLIIKNREAKLTVKPGYDGEYGELVLNGEGNKEGIQQKSLFDF